MTSTVHCYLSQLVLQFVVQHSICLAKNLGQRTLSTIKT
jgi:hypothetical protein